MKHLWFVILCCVALVGCKEGKKTVPQPPSAAPVVSQPAVHQHTAACNHSHEPVSAKTAEERKKAFYNQSEEQLARIVQTADAGNLKAAYMLSQYYSYHQDQAKAEEWKNKARTLAENASPDDATAKRFLQQMDRVKKTASAPKAPAVESSPVEQSAPSM